MHAVSCKRLVPLDVADDAISAGYSRRPPSDALHEAVHGRTILKVAICPPYSEGVQSVPLVLHTRCSQVIREVRNF